MYHCHIRFCLIGRRGMFEPLKGAAPLEHFTHDFVESEWPAPALYAGADVILADLWDQADAAGAVRTLEAGRKEGAELIVLADAEQAAALAERDLDLTELWIGPMTEAEMLFRFRRWQREEKTRRDLWEARHFLDSTINGTPNLIWYKNRNGVHEKVNNSFCRAAGKSMKQIQGQKHAYIWNVAAEDPACVASEKEVMRKRETCMSEETIRTGAGTKLLTTYKSPLYNPDGSVMGTVGVAIDVTRERRYERRLEEKNQLLEMILSSMDCGVICHTLNGQELISVNQAALRLLGYESREELIADGFQVVAESVLDEDKDMLRDRITSLHRIGDSIGVEYRVRHKDGKLLYLLGSVKLIEEGGRLLYQRFLLDITDQKLRDEKRWTQKDREIRYQKQIFQIFSDFLSDNVDDIYMMLDGEARNIEFVSNNLDRVLGLSPQGTENLLGQLGKVRYLTGSRVSRKELDALTPGTHLESRETERVHLRTGEHRWFRESVYCVSVEGSRKIIVYISDRTLERKNQNDLAEALEMARVASQAKTTFLSSVSHDIRTPMNAIMGMATLIQGEADKPERVKEYVQKISIASQHLLGLINNVLDMNKIESGSAALNISELDLAEVVEEMNTIVRPQAKEKNQTFEIHASRLTNEYLLGDKLRISQILINILSNAVKYTQEGGRIQMWVDELPQADPSYSRIRFTIQDNGQGMSKEYQRIIFDPFTRELDTGINEIQGSGLGMAITKSLVDLMHGDIRVSSTPGKGSTFVVELELRIQKQEDDPLFWKNLGLRRMIVVDDDEDVGRDILRKMNGSGVETTFITNGAHAAELIRSARKEGRPYDLVLLDWYMPELSGLDTARLIRRDDPDHLPVLLFTAHDWDDLESQARELGIRHYLSKPFFLSNFKELAARIMAPRKDAPPVQAASPLAGLQVLVVDDIEINRVIATKILTTLGAVCESAANGQEAVDRFLASRPGEIGLILMDIQMPVLNGYEAAWAIRTSEHPSAGTIPIIAMTANAFVDDIRSALQVGMDAHIAKPIVLDQMRKTITEVLERKRQGKRDKS